MAFGVAEATRHYLSKGYHRAFQRRSRNDTVRRTGDAL